MRPILLDFSQRPELHPYAQVIAEVQGVAAAMGIQPLIVGAFARDLHLVHAHRIPVERQTEDVDLALALDGWPAFEQLRKKLVALGRFAETTSAHRLRYGTFPIDLVPFGPLEMADRTIAWPPRGDVVMDVFGFREAERVAIEVLLPGDIRARVVTLPALALLKLVCWQDRHLRSPRKDASDLQLIIANYLRAGNEARLWDEFPQWTQEEDFDYDAAGARMLGHDIALLLDAGGRTRVTALLEAQSDPEAPGTLPLEMNRHIPERAIQRLSALLQGLGEAP